MVCRRNCDNHGQEAGQNYGFDSSRNKWIVSSWLLLCQGLRRRCEESAWKRRRTKTSLVVVMLLLRVMTYVVFNKLFWNWIGVVRFVSHEVWTDEGFAIWHPNTFKNPHQTVWWRDCQYIVFMDIPWRENRSRESPAGVMVKVLSISYSTELTCSVIRWSATHNIHAGVRVKSEQI